MTILYFTWMATITAMLAAAAWGVAMTRQWQSGRAWWALCLVVMLLHLYFAGIYLAVLMGVADGQAIGQSYLRPAISGLFLLMIAVALRFWRRA